MPDDEFAPDTIRLPDPGAPLTVALAVQMWLEQEVWTPWHHLPLSPEACELLARR